MTITTKFNIGDKVRVKEDNPRAGVIDGIDLYRSTDKEGDYNTYFVEFIDGDLENFAEDELEPMTSKEYRDEVEDYKNDMQSVVAREPDPGIAGQDY